MQLENLAGVVFHREGGLGLTTRFADSEMPLIGSQEWTQAPEHNITFSSGSHFESRAIVRELVPRQGDATGRWYTDEAGENHWVGLPCYGVVDPAAYLQFIREAIPREMRAWAATQGPAHQEALSLIETFDLPDLELLLCYDLGRYEKTKSAFLTGDDTLGIDKLPKDSQTMPGERPLPRVITAQCDNVLSIYLREVLAELFGEGNGALSKRLLSTAPLDTHVGYVAVRILTEGTLWILTDKVRRDRQNNTQDNTLQVRLQDSLNRLLANYSTVHRGIVFRDVISQIPKSSSRLYDSVSSYAPKQVIHAWQNPLYWLPALREVLASDSFKPKQVF